MKLFLVTPVVPSGLDEAAVAARLQACVEPIADLILAHLHDDPALFGMRHKSERSDPPLPMDLNYSYAQAVRLKDNKSIRAALVTCGNPKSGKWMLIRSLITCRAVCYEYDGQAFVCLPHEAASIVTPNPDLLSVNERSHMLADTDWMDGLRAE